MSSSKYFLRFNSLERNKEGLVLQSKANVLVLDNAGNVGINLNTAGLPVLPTANFDVNGTIRFQNLPAGPGNTLVIDNDGYIKRGSATGSSELKDKIKKLETDVKNLTAIVSTLLTTPPATAIAKMFNISPNPASSEIRIQAINNNAKAGSYYTELRDAGYNVVLSSFPLRVQ